MRNIGVLIAMSFVLAQEASAQQVEAASRLIFDRGDQIPTRFPFFGRQDRWTIHDKTILRRSSYSGGVEVTSRLTAMNKCQYRLEESRKVRSAQSSHSITDFDFSSFSSPEAALVTCRCFHEKREDDKCSNCKMMSRLLVISSVQVCHLKSQAQPDCRGGLEVMIGKDQAPFQEAARAVREICQHP